MQHVGYIVYAVAVKTISCCIIGPIADSGWKKLWVNINSIAKYK